MKIRTWHFETAFVATTLAFVVAFFSQHWIEWVGALAVLFTFNHGSIGFRAEEQEALKVSKGKPADVSCYKWISYYFYLKEVTWLLYSILLIVYMGAGYSILVSVLVFLLYPSWRRQWRKWYPVDR